MRCIRFDSKRIVSGAYDGKIKVWDLLAALDPRKPVNSLCLRTLVVIFKIFFLICKLTFVFDLQEHTGRVFRLQFDEFQIVSSSHDDTILIWDFLDSVPESKDNKSCNTSQMMTRTPSRKFVIINMKRKIDNKRFCFFSFRMI